MSFNGYMVREEFEQVEFHLKALKEDVTNYDKLRDHEREFVDQMWRRYEEYEDQMRCTLKQREWLSGLYDTIVNGKRRDAEDVDARSRGQRTFRRFSDV